MGIAKLPLAPETSYQAAKPIGEDPIARVTGGGPGGDKPQQAGDENSCTDYVVTGHLPMIIALFSVISKHE
jgi:hypothetical protein